MPTDRHDLFGPSRFVMVDVSAGKDVKCWGLLYDKMLEFIPLWAATEDECEAVREELGDNGYGGLMDGEVNSAINAEDPLAETPDDAWAALAHYQLTGASKFKFDN